jgi:hypothetical protein
MKVKITQPTWNPKDTTIEIDGKDITKHCKGYTVIAGVDMATMLMLNLVPDELEIDGVMECCKESSEKEEVPNITVTVNCSKETCVDEIYQAIYKKLETAGVTLR